MGDPKKLAYLRKTPGNRATGSNTSGKSSAPQKTGSSDADAVFREPEPQLSMDLTAKPFKQKPLNGGLALRDSVGRKGKNLPGDVYEVQMALNRVADAGLALTSKVDDKTIAAIKKFQGQMGDPNPDGLVEVGGLTARKLAGGKVIAKNKDDAMTARDPSQVREQLIRVANEVSQKARGNAAKFARRVSTGCDDFVVFANTKIDKLKQSEKAQAELVDFMGKSFFVAVGAVATIKVEDAMARYVTGKIVDILRDKVIEKGKEFAKTSKNFEELVAKFIQNTKDRANAIEDLVSQEVDSRCSRVIKSMQAGEPLSPEDDKFISPFVFADITGADDLLERRLGIPGAKSGRKIQLDILRGLVTAFMTHYIKANVDGNARGIEMNIRGSSPGEDAQVFATRYTKSREKHLDEVDRQVQSGMKK
jgi:hypothetical protein